MEVHPHEMSTLLARLKEQPARPVTKPNYRQTYLEVLTRNLYTSPRMNPKPTSLKSGGGIQPDYITPGSPRAHIRTRKECIGDEDTNPFPPTELKKCKQKSEVYKKKAVVESANSLGGGECHGPPM